MKSFLILLLFIFIGISSYSQKQDNKIYIVKNEKPILIINNEIIASADILTKIPSENILKLDILKESELSSIKLFSTEKSNNGIIKVDINFKLNVKTQKELNLFFGLDQLNNIYVNRYLIEDKTKSILTESMIKIELIKADNIFLKKASLNITIE
tara:strand:- start:73 stop:537 length:465 start_codon:yes stop_codon:yes gene_type:complete